MDKYYLNLYHNNVFIGKYISINHLLVMSSYSNEMRDQLKKDFTFVPEEYEDIKHGIKIILERPVPSTKGKKPGKKAAKNTKGL